MLKARRPCQFKYQGRVPEWDDSVLKRAAGDAMVEVEVAPTQKGGHVFGKGMHVAMPFSDFLDRFRKESMYLTTQDLRRWGDGVFPAIWAPPVSDLGIGIRPEGIEGIESLIPAAVNLWMGFSESATHTGLHCDFHDNIYLVLAGKKRFTVFPPASIKEAQPVGNVSKIHPNGLINFDRETRSDGSDPVASEAFDRMIQEGSDDAEDAFMDAILRLFGEEDDAEEEEEEEEEEEASIPDGPAERPLPPSFCQSEPKSGGLTFELEPGDALYLPASWLHRVESSGGDHLAVNWWFHPPDRELSYSSGFWGFIFERQSEPLDLGSPPPEKRQKR